MEGVEEVELEEARVMICLKVEGFSLFKMVRIIVVRVGQQKDQVIQLEVSHQQKRVECN